MDDHDSALRTVRRALVGRKIADDELDRALAHVTACEECARDFDVAEIAALMERGEEVPEMEYVPMGRQELFERALTAALLEPEAIVRRRAAERLGESEHLGAVALAGLAAVARDDADEGVRAAALAALAVNDFPPAVDNTMPAIAVKSATLDGPDAEAAGREDTGSAESGAGPDADSSRPGRS